MATRALFIVSLLFTLTACDLGPKSPRGFSLPEGDAKAGEMAFKKYQCTDCHTVDGIEVDESHRYILPQAIPLGGSSGRITTYGELVTSIINPSHKLTRRQPVSLTSQNGESRMRNMNDVLTVTELIDLVAFLQPKYKVVPYRTSDYRLYQLRMPDEESPQ